jgi:type I restriction enzyme R subunit
MAHQLAGLHDAGDNRIFHSVVVVTDRQVLDEQIQETVRQFEQTPGIVAAIDRDSAQLREALESGKQIVVTTLQKFPFIVEEIGKLPGSRFAVIIDEAHSSQSGEMSKDLKKVLTADSLEEAAAEEAERLQQALVDAAGEGAAPSDELMYEPIRFCSCAIRLGQRF